MYIFKTVTITLNQLNDSLKQEQRHTELCPFCKRTSIFPANEGCEFFMECTDCVAAGPRIRDYADPVGLNETSCIYALKVCHDRWNGSKS